MTKIMHQPAYKAMYSVILHLNIDGYLNKQSSEVHFNGDICKQQPLSGHIVVVFVISLVFLPHFFYSIYIVSTFHVSVYEDTTFS